eukprot:SM000092S24487  [mRNA]  locus=s92:204159:206394:+ [translate_table: standard]
MGGTLQASDIMRLGSAITVPAVLFRGRCGAAEHVWQSPSGHFKSLKHLTRSEPDRPCRPRKQHAALAGEESDDSPLNHAAWHTAGVPSLESRRPLLDAGSPPTTALQYICAAADVSLQQALLGLLDHPALPTTPAALLQMTLPIGKGDLGCRSPAHLACAAHLGCWAQVAATVSTRFSRRGQPTLAPAIAGVANGTLHFQTSLSDVRRDLLRYFPSLAADQVDFAAWARCSDLKAQARFLRAANERAMSHLKALLKEDGRGLSRLHSISSPGASEWLNALPIYESLRLFDDLFRTAVHHHLGLPPLCLAGIRQCYHAAMEVPGIMPVLQKRGRPYVRRLDVVATPRSGGPRLLLDVVLIDAFQPGAPTPTVQVG